MARTSRIGQPPKSKIPNGTKAMPNLVRSLLYHWTPARFYNGDRIGIPNGEYMRGADPGPACQTNRLIPKAIYASISLRITHINVLEQS